MGSQEHERRDTRIKVQSQSDGGSGNDGFIYSADDIPHDEGNDDEGEVDGLADQMDRFLGMVDWGNVQKPAGWDDEVKK
ncbi:hypothetical protein IAT40_005355 [Kwoniella sp. CBS 6097]